MLSLFSQSKNKKYILSLPSLLEKNILVLNLTKIFVTISLFIQYYLQIFFIVLLNTGIQSDSICFPFGETQQNETNSCSHTNGIRNPANGDTYSKCLTCTIKNNDIIKGRTCPEAYACIKLSFDNNTIFEKFFMKNRQIIKNLFINTVHTEFISILYIDIKSHNLTMITFKYMNRLLKLKYQPYEILNIKFGPSTNELKQIGSFNGFFETERLGIYIEIVCETINDEDQDDNDTDNSHTLYYFHDDRKTNETSIKYSIGHGEIKRTGPKTCTKFHPTKSMTIIPTSNTPVQVLLDSTNSQIPSTELPNTEQTLTKKTITSTITAISVTTEITSLVLTLTTTSIDKITTISTTIIPTTATITTIESTISRTILIITTETQMSTTLTSITMTKTAIESTLLINTLTTATETISSNLIMTVTTSLETTRQYFKKTVTTESMITTPTKQLKLQILLTTFRFSRETTFITTEKPTLDTKTTAKTIFYTNTNTRLFSSSTQSSSSTNVFLLSLLTILFILIICVVVISIWTFFRHNYLKRNKIDQNPNVMTNIDISTI